MYVQHEVIDQRMHLREQYSN